MKTFEERLKGGFYPNPPAKMPAYMQEELEVVESHFADRRLWTITQQNMEANAVVLYLHGGAFVANITQYQWDMVGVLAGKTQAMFVVPDYPLAPGVNCREVYEFIDQLYKQIRSDYPQLRIIMMGDSSGAGMVLGYAQQLRDEGGHQPEQILLISPLLDVTMSNPALAEVEDTNKMLTAAELQLAVEIYADGMDHRDYRLSPIYGNFKGLGKISLFIGTHDLMIADSRKLKQMLEGQGIDMHYHEYERMFHVFLAVTRLKESREALDIMANRINQL